MTDVRKPTAAEITDETIQQWKEKHGKVTRYKTRDGKVAYFKSPERHDIAASSAAREEKDGITANQVLAKAIFLGGDYEICTTNKYLFGLGKHLSTFVDQVEGESEEL